MSKEGSGDAGASTNVEDGMLSDQEAESGCLGEDQQPLCGGNVVDATPEEAGLGGKEVEARETIDVAHQFAC